MASFSADNHWLAWVESRGATFGGMGDPAKVIDWNGTDVPAELIALPPGRYLILPAPEDEADEGLVSPETEARILAGRADVAAGRTVPWAEVDAGHGRIIAAHTRR